MTLKERLKRTLARLIQDRRRTWIMRQAARFARFYTHSWEYPSFEIAENGEEALLGALAGEDIRTVFDVGANVGDWSLACARAFPKARIHAFEPVGDTHGALVGHTRGEARITPHPFGLAKAAGAAEFTYYGAENSFLSTMSTPIYDHLPSRKISIMLRRGDDAAVELGVERIDFLKIDVEGMELDVLEGLGAMLAAGRVGLIQFEKQPGHRLLKDYFTFFTGLNYRVGKIYSTYVDFRPYDSGQERTAGPNYLAVPSARLDLVRRLQEGFSR